MNRRVLMIIGSDPRVSARPAEAIRIAAGVGTWKKAQVTVYLRGAAVLALSAEVDELVDEDNYVRYLPILKDFGQPIYVQKGAPLLADLGEATLPFEAISDAQLAELSRGQTSVMRF